MHSFHSEIPFFKPKVFGDAGAERAQLSPCIFGVQFWGMAGIRSLFVRDQIPFCPGAEGGPEHEAPAPGSFQLNKTTDPAQFRLSGLWFIPGLQVASKSYQFHTDFEGIIPSRLLFPWHGLPGAQGLTRARCVGRSIPSWKMRLEGSGWGLGEASKQKLEDNVLAAPKAEIAALNMKQSNS